MTCFQLFRRLISETQCLLTPNCAAMRGKVSPSTISCRIFNTSSSVKSALAFLEPINRPFLAASPELSEGVPRKRWSGLKHLRLSHLWQTFNLLSPSIPKYILAEMRWTLPVLRLMVTTPYPSSSTNPVHSQHPDNDETCLLNIRRRIMVSLSQCFGRNVIGFRVPFLHHLA